MRFKRKIELGCVFDSVKKIRLENGSRTWRFKRKIELDCVFDSVKKLPADVVRQNITNAGGPEASRYLFGSFVPRCHHGLGLLKTKPSLGSLQPS